MPCHLYASLLLLIESNISNVDRLSFSIWVISIAAQVEEKGLQMSDAVLAHVYVQNMDDFAAINSEYGRLFPVAPPAR